MQTYNLPWLYPVKADYAAFDIYYTLWFDMTFPKYFPKIT